MVRVGGPYYVCCTIHSAGRGTWDLISIPESDRNPLKIYHWAKWQARKEREVAKAYPFPFPCCLLPPDA